MTERTQEWAERVGREAVGLGFRVSAGHMVLSAHPWLAERVLNVWPDREYVPDFRDRLTELACIAWVEDVAREVYGKGAHVKVSLPDEKFWAACVYIGTPGSWGSRTRHEIDRDTLAEACIAAVRAMKGGRVMDHAKQYDHRAAHAMANGCPECGESLVRGTDEDGCCLACGADVMHNDSGELRPCPVKEGGE